MTTRAPGPQRRSVLLLGVGAGAAALTGCTLNNPFSSGTTPAAKAVRDLAPDVGVAVQAVALLVAAQTELESLIAAVPRFADHLGGLRSTYEAYAAALRGAVPHGVDVTSAPSPAASGTGTPTPGTPTPGTPTPGTPPPTPSPTLAADARLTARRTAATLHAQLTGFALRAESGVFARLLGSMAAGLSQQLVVLR